jgi:hypothetical protein
VWRDNDPAVIIQNTIVGCQEQCPFCKEQCEGGENHLASDDVHLEDQSKHACRLHRPQCLGGYSWKNNGVMTLDICTDLVATDDTRFKCLATNDEYVPCKDYHSIYPNWKITSDKNQVAPYWKWFIVKYEKEITEHFNFKSAPLPQDWKCVTQDAARDDVIKRFQLKLD